MALLLFPLAGGNAAAQTARLLLTGSTAMAPLMVEVAKRFQIPHPGIQFEVQMGGSCPGVSNARQGKVDDEANMLSTHPVQVIVSDQRMPGMSGTEFLSRVRDLYPDTVRLVLSGYTELGSITDAINRGAIYKFLTKPWDEAAHRCARGLPPPGIGIAPILPPSGNKFFSAL